MIEARPYTRHSYWVRNEMPPFDENVLADFAVTHLCALCQHNLKHSRAINTVK